jgi:adenosylcobinamide kinase/adenosylcobinamide-phosphate guanylyltransferase
MLELILGGARSGKSRIAEQHALASNKSLIYIATAEALDKEMTERIAEHRLRRDDRWQLVEEPLALAKALKEHSRADNCILVDCLTLWLNNLLHLGDEHWQREREALLKTLVDLPGDIILVSNEVGQGIVPLGELSRIFVDQSGWLHQDLARISDRVLFVVAGLPQILKSPA